jgi:hydrogenase maturation protease
MDPAMPPGIDAPVRVLGLGNVLMGDDAAGPAVVETFAAEYDVDPRVLVLDVGTPGLDLTPYLSGADLVILVDTLKADGAAGEIRRHTRTEILRHAPQPRIGPHDPGVKEAILALDFACRGPRDVVLIGVIPGAVAARPGLSAPVRGAIPAAVAAIVEELARAGLRPVPRPGARPPRFWWEDPSPA